MLENHYEYLNCGHQNNLLIIQSDGKKSKPNACPKGCINTKVLQVSKIDLQISGVEITEES